MNSAAVFVSILLLGTSLMQYIGAAQEMDGALDPGLDSLLDIRISTAAKYDQTAREAAASVTIITSEEVQQLGYRTLDEVLMYVRGFYTSNDRNYSYVGVRGFGRPTDYNNRLLLLMNGHTLNENVYGSAMMGTELGIGLESIERIEIVRGPGSALYGNNAVFAVINLVTKKGNLIDGSKMTVEVGSFGYRQGSALVGKELKGGTDIALSVLWGERKGQDLYYPEYDLTSTNNGIARRLDWDRPRGIVSTLRYGEFSMQAMFTSRSKGIPTGAFGILFGDPRAQTVDERSFFETQYNHAIDSKKNVTVRAYFDNYHYDGVYPYDFGPERDATNNVWFGGEFKFAWDVESSLRFTAGAEFQQNQTADYRLWTDQQFFFYRNFPFSVFAVYLQDEVQLNQDISVTIGVRQDKNSTYDAVLSPRAAVVYNPTRAATLKLLYGEAFRAPNIYELHYEDPFANTKANPHLRPERIQTIEFAWEQRITRELFGNLSAFNYRMRDLINQIFSPVDSMSVFENVSAVEASGVELELNTRTYFGLSGRLSYSIEDAYDGLTNEHLTNSPAQIAKFTLVQKVLPHLSFSLRFLYETPRKTLHGGQTSGTHLTDVSIIFRPQAKVEDGALSMLANVRCSLLVRNLFNAMNGNPGGLEHLQSVIVQNGRSYSIKVDYTF